MTDIADQRFAPPQAHVADIAPAEQVLAGRGTRLLAAIVDTIIGATAGWAVMQIPLLKGLIQAQQSEVARSVWSWTPLSLLVGVAVFLLVQGWPLARRGQTIGKMVCKLRIVRTDGTPAEPWRLLGLRYGVGMLTNLMVGVAMVYGLVDSLLIFRGSRQCLHDTIAGTKVIRL